MSASTIPHHSPGGDPARRSTAPAASSAPHARSRLRRLASRVAPELAILLLLAGFLNLWNLSVSGEANTYYSAAVKTMSQSWSAFLWGTFDPSGLMTVDKPPLALWVQALSVRAFGFSSWAMLVPQALMGMAAVGLVYDLTRRMFGRAGGFVAGLVLALTPTAVAIFRHNNPDAALALCIVAALWAVIRGLQDGRTRWLVIAGVAVGLGFTAKMAAALLVVPGLIAAWMWMRPGGGVRRTAGQLAAFGWSAAAVGLAWPVVAWLVPASDRPWISGTSDNSIWSLIFGYNGLGRLLGQSGGPGGAGGAGAGAGAGGGGLFGGETGPLRLLNDALGSQGGWLLGAAVGAGVLILAATRLRRNDVRTGWLIATGGAFAVTAAAFSFASGIFHPYYVSALAPFTAALVGGGFATALGLVRRDAAVGGDEGAESAPRSAGGTDVADGAGGEGGADVAGRSRETLLLTGMAGAMLVAGAVTESVVLGNATQLGWLTPVLLVATVAAAGVMLAVRSQRVRIAVLSAAMGLLLVAPGVWSAQTLGHSVGSTFPTGGPTSGMQGGPRGGPGGFGGPGSGRGGFGGPGGMLPPGVSGSGSSSSSSSSSSMPGLPPGAASGTSVTGGAQGAPPALPGVSGSGVQGSLPAMPGASAQGGSSSTGSGAQGGSSSTGGAQGGSSAGGAQGGSSAGGPGAGGGMFGGDQSTVSSALAYAKANGGGTVVVSGQMGAANAILSSGANVAGIGGFSGRESEVSVDWFAGRVAAGKIRWVVTSSGGLQDSRTGSNTVMSAVTSTCTAVSSVSGLYDCQGQAAALQATAQ